jgi:tRNA modification GTPase
VARKPLIAETIAAIATPPGRGGVGVVRVSGLGLGTFVQALIGRPAKPRTAHLAHFLDVHGSPIDEGLLLYFPAPHSYTGEDVVELQGHGGPVVMQMLLARCLELGARLAAPGEFTQRAFLNDKLDLVQAEGVIDLIDAGTQAAARSALRSLSGRFSEEIHALRDHLIDLRMLVEATLDFPEEEIDFLKRARAMERLAALRQKLGALLRRARQGSLLREGMHVVLAGAPNVGKSSLLNCLAGEDRAIVTDVAGTTRDVLRERIQIEGIPLHIVDTAGLRDTSDTVERIGIERTWREIGRADVIVRLHDAAAGASDVDIGGELVGGVLPVGIPVLHVFNKVDLTPLPAGRYDHADGVAIRLSARTGAGVSDLTQALLEIVGWSGGGEDAILARERHIEALRDACEHIEAAEGWLGELELMAEELRLAQEAVNRITGEFGADDLLGVIFSRFCIGK